MSAVDEMKADAKEISLIARIVERTILTFVPSFSEALPKSDSGAHLLTCATVCFVTSTALTMMRGNRFAALIVLTKVQSLLDIEIKALAKGEALVTEMPFKDGQS